MHRHITMVLVVALLAVLVIPVVGYAQAPRGPMGGGPGAPGMDRERMMSMALDRLQLSPAENKAAQQALAQKMAAMRTVSEHLRDLQQLAENPRLSDDQARKALGTYQKYQDAYEKQVRSIDRDLARKVSPRSLLRLKAAGIISNGVRLGMRGMGRPGGMGPGIMPGMGRPGAPAPGGRRPR